MFVIGIAMADGFLKNGGIGGNADHAVFVQQAFELAGGELSTVNVIVPDALSIRLE